MEYHLKQQSRIEDAIGNMDPIYENENCYKAMFGVLGGLLLAHTNEEFLDKLDRYVEHFQAQIKTRRSKIGLNNAQMEESEKKVELT